MPAFNCHKLNTAILCSCDFLLFSVCFGRCISLQNGCSLIKFPINDILHFSLFDCISICYFIFILCCFCFFAAGIQVDFQLLEQFANLFYKTAKNCTMFFSKRHCKTSRNNQFNLREIRSQINTLECGNKCNFLTFCLSVSNLIGRRVQFNRIKSILQSSLRSTASSAEFFLNVNHFMYI